MITYKKMSLFDAPPGTILVHACNTKGSWGAGIALEFQNKFPLAYVKYQNFCESMGLIGLAPMFQDNDYHICCLLVSSGYGKNVSSKEEILVNTTIALNSLCSNENWAHYSKRTVYSNKFNSGLFRVPWKETEKILRVLTDRYRINWIVCDPDMET